MKRTRFSSPRYFKLSKKQNANEILEDYVEAIEEISKDKKDVKTENMPDLQSRIQHNEMAKK